MDDDADGDRLMLGRLSRDTKLALAVMALVTATALAAVFALVTFLGPSARAGIDAYALMIELLEGAVA